MNDKSKRKMSKEQRNKVIASAFLMATSAIGPAFLTQTASFTETYGPSFAFVIVCSIIVSIGVQMNIWRILTITGKYGQDLANDVFPGLGYFVSGLIVLGGFAFNIANVAGAGMGFNGIFGLDVKYGAILTGALTIGIFLSKNGQSIVDQLVKVLGILMIILTLFVTLRTHPPYGEVFYRMVNPESVQALFMPLITLIGGTVGGYITFSGAHRLIDSRMTGEDNLPFVSTSAASGILGTGVMRVLIFLAVLGTVSQGVVLDPNNPAATPFSTAFGKLGMIMFGFVILSAALSSVIGAAYTSASFLRTFHPIFSKYNNLVIVGFIAISTLVFAILGRPVTLLIIAGALNGLIVPITLGVCLLASRRKDLMGNYKHPNWLFWYGVIACILTLIFGLTSLKSLAQLWAA